jgi:rhodanese-related sulfurtransferase
MGIDSRVVIQNVARDFYPFRLLTLDRAREAFDTMRVFELRQGESITLKGGKSRDYLFILVGALRFSHELTDEFVARAEDTRERPVFIPAAPYAITAVAAADAVFCVADAVMFDTLLLWDELARCARKDDALCDRLAGVRHALAFSGLPLEGWMEAFGRMTRREVAEGEIVVPASDDRPALVILKEGAAEATRTDADATTVVVAELAPGAVFGEEAAVAEEVRTATVTMLTDGVTYVLSQSDFIDIVAMPHVAEIDALTARDRLETGARLLDIRYENERAESSIPGSAFIPLHDLQERMGELADDVDYIVYCRSGRRSKAAVGLMTQAGIRAASLAGGIIGWPFDIVGDTF